MISSIRGNAEVGWYNAAYNLVLALGPIPTLLMSTLLPRMSSFSVSSRDMMKVCYEYSFKYLLILGLPMTFGTVLLSEKIILSFYGHQFVNSITALQILSLDILLMFLYQCLGFTLISIDRQKQMAFVAGLCVALKFVMNLILIPNFGYIGSAIATIATEGSLFSIYFYMVSKNFYRLQLSKILLLPLLASFIMCMFIIVFKEINIWLLITISAVLYFTVLILIKGFSTEDQSLMRQLVLSQEL